MLRIRHIPSCTHTLCTDNCASLFVTLQGANRHHVPLRYHPRASSWNGKKQNQICLSIKCSLTLKLDPVENLLNWTWEKRRKKKNWVINQHFVQPDLVLKDIHQDQHTCPSRSWVWTCGLDRPIVCSPFICKPISVKVTVCGNGNHMG